MGRRQRARARSSSPEASARYTPPTGPDLRVRVRPPWHKVAGAVLAVLGLAIVLVNFLDVDGVSILPGGHQEAYFLLGILVAGSSVWWFGAFDRDPDPAEIRREIERQRAERAAQAKERSR